MIVIGLVLHLAAWFAFPPERARIVAPSLLANLYVSSAVTTFGIIALIVGYASPWPIAPGRGQRTPRQHTARGHRRTPEENPDESVADSVAEASVLFSNIVGFTGLASGSARSGP